MLDSVGEECDDGNSNRSDGCSPECLIEQCLEIDAAATGHTCQHGSFGPFATIQGFAYPGSVFGNVSAPHTYFTMTLSGELGNNRSATEFMPVVDESYAIYLKKPYPMVLRSPEGEPVPVRFEHAITTCEVADSLTWVRVYGPLTASTGYIVDVGPWEEAEVSFAFESLGSFSSDYFLDQDGDGFNGEESVAFSPCVPDEPFDASPGDDCDDDADGTHPGAAEACDGIDTDCDGADPPAGESCDVGGTGGSGGAGGVTSSRGSSPEATVSTATGGADSGATDSAGVTDSAGAAGAEEGSGGSAAAAGAAGTLEDAAAASGGASGGGSGSGGSPSSGGTDATGSGGADATSGADSGCGCVVGPGAVASAPGALAWVAWLALLARVAYRARRAGGRSNVAR